MKKLIMNIVVIALFSVCYEIIFSGISSAEFNMTLTPRLGGQDINFKTIKPGSEINTVDFIVNVRSDIAKQYQVTQIINSPLQNIQGQMLPASNITVQTIQSSAGTLNATTPMNLQEGARQLLYTSNPSGTTDEVLLIYAINIPNTQPPGVYNSTTSFELRSVDGTQGPQILTINISVEIQTQLLFKVTQESGGTDIDFGTFSGKESTLSKQTLVSIESNLAGPYRVTQTVTQPLTNEMGNTLDFGDLIASVLNVTSGTASANNATINPYQPLTLFESDSSGSSSSFVVNYALNIQEKQKAGRYRGVVNFALESQGNVLATITKEVSVMIEPIFNLDVRPLDAQTSLSFGNVMPGQTSQTKDIMIKVKSNMGKQYQVIQNLAPQLTDASGNVLGSDNISVSVSNVKLGSSQYMAPVPINSQQMVIYTSSMEGDPEEFMATYKLTMPENAIKGNYNVTLTYTLSSV